MKSALKALAWTVASVAALTGLIWVGSLLYWHVRIASALKTWKDARTSTSSLANYVMSQDALRSAGCRALPYLVASLETSDNDPDFQSALMKRLISALAGPGPLTEERWRAFGERASRWEFIAEGLAVERKEKLADFRAWWLANGDRYHSWWRTWSAWCFEE